MLGVFENPLHHRLTLHTYIHLYTHIYTCIYAHNHVTYYAFSFDIQTNLPIFKLKDSCVRRRYSDFEWL